jgi:hypothetical protein
MNKCTIGGKSLAEMVETCEAKTGKKLSTYNVFMGECMKGRGKMKECAQKWHNQKLTQGV